MIGGDEILEHMNSARVGRGISADRAGALAGRIGREMKRAAARHERDRVAQRRVAHARLHVRNAILQIDLEDAVHLHCRDDHAVVERHASAGQAGPRAAGNDLRIVLDQRFENSDDLIVVDGKTHCRRTRFGDREPVGFIDKQLVRIGDDPIR